MERDSLTTHPGHPLNVEKSGGVIVRGEKEPLQADLWSRRPFSVIKLYP
jgi:hypothetical protein